MRHRVRVLNLIWALCHLAPCLAATAQTEPQTPGVQPSVVLNAQTQTAVPLPQDEGSTVAVSSCTTSTTQSSTYSSSLSHKPAAVPATTPGTCAFASINHVTRPPPSQCYTQARPSKCMPSASQDIQATSNASSTSRISSEPTSVIEEAAQPVATIASIKLDTTTEKTALALPDAITSPLEMVPTTQAATSATPRVVAVEIATVIDPETESPLNDAKFLSFEDWKKQNLPRVPDDANARQPRPAIPRPGLDTALEGLGDEGEIDFDFSGFRGSIGPGQAHQGRHQDANTATPLIVNESEQASTTQKRRPRDAGKTCKERSNYASFDCGSSVLKTNPQGKKASSILVENKDSYMLNECSASNKFLIVELCDEIKIDTIVLANFEFFSSIFRTFKVSVSDRYPVRIDKWKDIGTFEARNTRDIQAFLVENHAGFARYVRIEFLTHFGSEYYCPVSLFRIHGVTAFEEYKLEQLSAEDREGDDDEENSAPQTVLEQPKLVVSHTSALPELVTTEAASPLSSISHDHEIQNAVADTTVTADQSPTVSATMGDALTNITESKSSSHGSHLYTSSAILRAFRPSSSNICYPNEVLTMPHASGSTTSDVESPSETSSMVKHQAKVMAAAKAIDKLIHSESAPASASASGSAASVSIASQVKLPSSGQLAPSSISMVLSNDTSGDLTIATHSTTPSGSSSSSLVPTSSSFSAPMTTSSPASAHASSTVAREPANQESFFKTIHKRLQHLEANSTLSLQYIESQSALLREAFGQVEKRQLAKTTTFLSLLNATVSAELTRFQSEYEQLWQSTLMELASQRDEGRRERELLGERVKVLAEEMVNQKRLMAAQATILLLCLGLIVFSKLGGLSTTIDSSLIQGMQEIVNKGKKMRAEEKDRLGSNRWRWESPWASPSRRSKGSGVITPVARDSDRTGASTPRSFEELEGDGVDFAGQVGMPPHPYATLDGQERALDASSLTSPEFSQIMQGSQAIRSAPTTPMSEVPPEGIPEKLHEVMSNG